MPRGFKICSNCENPCGPRSFNCKHCGQSFKMNEPVEQKEPVVGQIEEGDYIRVKNGSGPYFIRNGEKVYYTQRGVFKVLAVKEKGLDVVGVGLKSTGYSFLYTGPDEKSPLCSSLVNSAYRIVKVRRPRS